MTINALRAFGRKQLKDAGISSYLIDADALLLHVLEIDKNTLLTQEDKMADEEAANTYFELISNACAKMPIEHILGRGEFMSLEFILNEHVLIPRIDTEILVNTVLKNESHAIGLEIGVGSGCIAVALEYYGTNLTVYGVDVSGEAIWIATQNWMRIAMMRNTANELLYGDKSGSGCDRKIKIEDAFSNRKYINSNLFENIPSGMHFDFIVSNPPYIETDEITMLDDSVKQYEPIIALDGGTDGMDFYRRICAEAPKYLTEDGRIYFEIGYNQGEEVKKIVSDAGFVDVMTLKDTGNRDRVVWGRMV